MKPGHALEIYDRVHRELDEGKSYDEIDNGLNRPLMYEAWLGYMQGTIIQELREMLAMQNSLYDALDRILERYIGLVESGDCGFWNPEDEEEVKQARAALLEVQRTN